VAFVDLGGPGRDPLARQLTHEVAELALLLVQRVIRHS
jgi:hypothetical protein